MPTTKPSFTSRRALGLLCAAAIGLLLSACGGGDSSPQPVATPTSVTTQPSSTTAIVGAAASFSVGAVGDGLTYKWQQSSDAGSTWTEIGGATQSSYTISSTTAAQSGYRFRAIVAGTVGAAITSTAAVLTLTQIPSFSSHPISQTVLLSGVATFNIVSSGLPAPTIQWQVSSDSGATFTNVVGATDASYATGTTTISDSGKHFRTVATNSTGSANSNVAILTVNRPTYPSLQALGQLSVTSGQFLDFAAANDYLYIAAGFDGIRVIDTSDLMSPRQVGAIPHSTAGANDQVVAVAIASSTLIVSVYPGCAGFCQVSNGEIRLYDLATPTEPHFVAALPTAAYSFAVDGATIFALGPPSGFSSLSSTLRAIDVTSPSSPRVLSTLRTANATRLVKHGSRLFLGFSERFGGSPGLQAIDVSNPSALAIVDTAGSPSLEAGRNDVVADSTAVFTASGTAEVRSYPTSGPLLGPASTTLPKSSSGLALSGTLLLVSQADNGVAVFQRDSGTGIALQTNFSVNGVCLAVEALGGYGVARVAEVRTNGATGSLVRPERLVFFVLPQ